MNEDITDRTHGGQVAAIGYIAECESVARIQIQCSNYPTD